MYRLHADVELFKANLDGNKKSTRMGHDSSGSRWCSFFSPMEK